MLQLAPDECLMVACHPFDLDAAAKAGFHTALVCRPAEWGPDTDDRPEMPAPGTYDIEVDIIVDIAAAVRP